MTVGVGVVGLGFMGGTHLGAYAAAGDACRVVAVADRDPARRAGRTSGVGNIDTGGSLAFDPQRTRAYAEAAELLADPDVELVSITTPTDTHVDLGVAALEAGKHVLVEKPVALAVADAERLADAARRAAERGLVCLPAHCMRFWPGWDWLQRTVRAGTLGAVRSAVFRRLAARPGWSDGFYGDPSRTGGALFDLHVHDADMVRWLFGDPAPVATRGDLDHVTTLYGYAGAAAPLHVVAEGGWDHADGYAFRMEYTVVFEGGTAEFVFGREAPLLLARDGAVEPVPLASGTGYEGQVRHLLARIDGREREPVVTAEDAVAVTRLLARERASLEGAVPDGDLDRDRHAG